MGRGGLETMIMNYYRHMDRTQVQFDFLVHRNFEADYDKEIETLGGRIHRLPNLNPFSKEYLSKLNDFFREHHEYQIVHSHLDCMAGIPLKVAMKYDVPVRIAHAHSSNQTKGLKYPLKLMFKKNICKAATHLFACSQDAGRWMFKTDDFTVLNNAIDTQLFNYNETVRNQIRKELQLEKDEYVIGHVGRFASVKNHDFLVDVFNEFKKKHENLKLLLVGDGDLRSQIKEKVNLLNLSDDVIFTGNRNDVHALMQAMDVFVFPSLYEGLPVTIVEAQTSGLPCIISEKVPIECKKTDLVEQISLTEGAQKWADIIEKKMTLKRRDYSEEIIRSEFDIRKNAEKLQKFYMGLVK